MFDSNKENSYIVVNYHYVESPQRDRSGVFPCDPREFERQISFLAKTYSFVSLSDIFLAAHEGRGGKFCAITFDDGLKGQYIHALPVLKKYKIPGVFFIITASFEGKIPSAHKIHLLLSRISAERLIDMFHASQNEYHIPKDKRINEGRRLFEDVMTANFKETLLGLPKDAQDAFLRRAFIEFSFNEKEQAESLFMDKDEVKDLVHSGCLVGSHSHNHYALHTLGKDDLDADIVRSREALFGVTGEYPVIFSYPHGRYSSDVISSLEKNGFLYACIITEKEVDADDNRYAIPRVDTNTLKRFMDQA